MLQDLSNIEAFDFSAEAKDSAIQRISDILRHPDDLTNKLDKIQKKIGHERAKIEAQLKTALEAQLENVDRGLNANELCKNLTLKMKESLVSMDSLCSNSQNTIKNYSYIKKVANIILILDIYSASQFYRDKKNG
jgi:exocyst complex component 3